MHSDLPHIALYPNHLTFDKKIQAIKDVRSATGLGLKEAKVIVDNMVMERATIIYANDIGALSENSVNETYSMLARSPNFLRAELRASVRPVVTDQDPLRGVAFESAVLAVVFAAEEGDVALALSKVKTLATVTQDPTFKAAVIVLGKAHDRINGRLDGSLLSGGYKAS